MASGLPPPPSPGTCCPPSPPPGNRTATCIDIVPVHILCLLSQGSRAKHLFVPHPHCRAAQSPSPARQVHSCHLIIHKYLATIPSPLPTTPEVGYPSSSRAQGQQVICPKSESTLTPDLVPLMYIWDKSVDGTSVIPDVTWQVNELLHYVSFCSPA